MDKLTNVWERNQNKEELTNDDLKFIYEIEHKIEGFGYERDSRITDVLKGRNVKEDIAKALSSEDFIIKSEQISLNKEEALSGDIVYHYGTLYLRGLSSAEGLKLPDSIGGGLNLSGLISAEGLKLPDSIGDNLDFRGLSSIEKRKLRERHPYLVDKIS